MEGPGSSISVAFGCDNNLEHMHTYTHTHTHTHTHTQGGEGHDYSYSECGMQYHLRWTDAVLVIAMSCNCSWLRQQPPGQSQAIPNPLSPSLTLHPSLSLRPSLSLSLSLSLRPSPPFALQDIQYKIRTPHLVVLEHMQQ